MKPSPVLPRTNLSRSQSVYASKRLEYQPKFESLRKQTTPHSGPHPHHIHQHHNCNETNYESLYDRKPQTMTPVERLQTNGGPNLLMSGPPSYESNFYKAYDTASSKSHGHNHHHHNTLSSHHKRQTSDIHDNHTNRILAQYETSKGLVDVDPKAALKSQNKAYYESEYNRAKEKEAAEKKLIDTSASDSENPPPPPRFRMPSSQNQNRFQPPGQCLSDHIPNPNDLSHHISHSHQSSSVSGKDHGTSSIPKKPYELLDNPNRKLLDFSPNHSNPHSSLQQTPNSLNSNNNPPNSNPTYGTRLLMTEKDSTYSRILEPLMNSKPLAGGGGPNGTGCRMSPNDQYMYSYH